MTKIFFTDTSCLFNDAVFDGAKNHILPWRCSKLERLKFRQDKNLSLGASLMLSCAISSVGMDITEKEIAYHKNGKPYFKTHADVHFSLSHSGNIALCALSDKETGADVQLMCDFKESICRRYFLKSEADFVLGAKSYEDKKDRFFKIWCLKEAYAKMTGEGLGSFSDFEICLFPSPSVKRKNALTVACLKEYEYDGYKIAVCTRDTESDFEFQKINILNLLIN